MNNPQKEFGGDWSDKKLEVLRKYLDAYTQVMKNQPFTTTYIDAFAGAGNSEDDHSTTKLRHGSPLNALEVTPSFDKFIFIEKFGDKLERLKLQVNKQHSDKIVSYREGDANKHLLDICSNLKWNDRAAVFLDPFALELKWETIKAIGQTKKMDVWLLFPAMAVNRMMARNEEKISEAWERKLDQTFGENSWKEFFYEEQEPDLFGDIQILKKTKPFDMLSQYVTMRLRQEFGYSNEKPLMLKNSAKTPIFLFCFACGDPKGSKIALDIANYLINQQSNGH